MGVGGEGDRMKTPKLKGETLKPKLRITAAVMKTNGLRE